MNQPEPVPRSGSHLNAFDIKFLILAGIAMTSLVLSVFFGIQSTLSNGLKEQRDQSAADRRAFQAQIISFQEAINARMDTLYTNTSTTTSIEP